jgi:penicillin-binding protein-related factor A (putative recombinase)
MTIHEKDLQKAVIDLLEYKGAVVIKINNVGIMKPNGQYIPPRQKGISDLIACYKGKFIAIELKAGNNKPTEYQLTFLEQVKKAGGIALWTNNIDDVISFFKKL